jgi:hypothetical protein
MSANLLVGTRKGLYEFDGERKKTRIADHEVRSLLNHNGEFWTIIDQQEIWRSGTRGHWKRVTELKDFQANCLLQVSGTVWVGASKAHLFTLRGERIEPLRSFEQIEGRERWYTPRGNPPDVRSMSTDSDGTLYVNVHVGGVLRSIDGGKSWEATIAMDKDVHQVLFDEPSHLVLAASAFGLAVSEDRAKSWRIDTDGLHGNYLRAVTVAGDTVLVTASTGPRTNQAGVYRRPIGNGQPFTRCRNGLPEWFPQNIDTFCLAASDGRVAFGTVDGSAFLSEDAGKSWTEVARNLPPVLCVALRR